MWFHGCGKRSKEEVIRNVLRLLVNSECHREVLGSKAAAAHWRNPTSALLDAFQDLFCALSPCRGGLGAHGYSHSNSVPPTQFPLQKT